MKSGSLCSFSRKYLRWYTATRWILFVNDRASIKGSSCLRCIQCSCIQYLLIIRCVKCFYIYLLGFVRKEYPSEANGRDIFRIIIFYLKICMQRLPSYLNYIIIILKSSNEGFAVRVHMVEPFGCTSWLQSIELICSTMTKINRRTHFLSFYFRSVLS